jgi:hypothetical protein
VTLQLRDEIDLSRGDMLVSPNAVPPSSRHLEAMVVWLHPQPLKVGQRYLVKHNVRTTRGKAVQIRHRINVNTLERESAEQLGLNEIAAVEFETASPLHFDPYHRNRNTGSFILIDPISNATLGAAMIRRETSSIAAAHPTPGAAPLSNEEKYRRHGHGPAIVLAEGRSSLARLLERTLFDRGFEVLLVTHAEASSHQVATAAQIAHAAGLVLIYAGSIDAKAKRELSTLAAGQLFDLTTLKLSADDQEAARQATSLLESLRYREAANEKGVN